jgi:hypothetical protein
MKITVITDEEHHSYQLHDKFYPVFLLQGYSHEYTLLVIINVDFDVTVQLLIRLFASEGDISYL